MRTQVGIVGAGPAGLVLTHLLARAGIDSVVLENRSRGYIEQRVRAGVLEQNTVDLLRENGLAQRLDREGLVHHGLDRIPLSELTGGRAITVYGQQEVVKDLVKARLEAGGEILFEVDDVSLHELDSERPAIRFRHDGGDHELRCDVVAGCDGYHGISRPSIPAGVLTGYEREYPFAWLGILAEAPPSSEELIYCSSERGFALHSMRSPKVTRLYLQVDPAEDLANWPDEHIWEELRARFATDDGWALADGPLLEKGITSMRSFVVEPMQYGRLYLAGDAAHIVPATGAKGLNLAVADVRILAEALEVWYRTGRSDLLDAYSAACLRRVWRVQQFSWWMTSMLHLFDDQGGFDRRLQLSQLAYVCSSTAAATSLAENYVGLPYV